MSYRPLAFPRRRVCYPAGNIMLQPGRIPPICSFVNVSRLRAMVHAEALRAVWEAAPGKPLGVHSKISSFRELYLSEIEFVSEVQFLFTQECRDEFEGMFFVFEVAAFHQIGFCSAMDLR